MNEVVYQHFGNTIVIHSKGQTFTIARGDKRFETVDQLIREHAVEAAGIAADPNSGYYKVMARILAATGALSLLGGG